MHEPPRGSGAGDGCYASPSHTGGRPGPDGWRRLRKTSVRILVEPCYRRVEPADVAPQPAGRGKAPNENRNAACTRTPSVRGESAIRAAERT